MHHASCFLRFRSCTTCSPTFAFPAVGGTLSSLLIDGIDAKIVVHAHFGELNVHDDLILRLIGMLAVGYRSQQML